MWTDRGPTAILSITEVAMLANRNTLAIELGVSKRITTAIFAAALGVFFVYFTAFSHSTTLHNSAHDTRHAIATPCH